MWLTKQDNLIEIRFSYDPKLILLVRSLSNRRYDATKKVWTVPLSEANGSLKKLLEAGFKMNADLEEALIQEKNLGKEVESLKEKPDIEFESSLPLMKYQKVGAAFLDKIGSGLLGDEVGLGKTIQTLAVLEKNKPDKVLIFCPAILKHQWREEFEKFGLDWPAVVIEGNADQRAGLWRKDAMVYIANYELLLRDFPLIGTRTWNYIVADEATRISNPQAKQSRLIKKLQGRKRIALTGTPISNRANEIWNILDWIAPGVFGNYFQFIERYCLKNRFGAIVEYQDLDNLQKRVRRYMIRRTKEQVLPELPEKIVSDIPFRLSEEEGLLYRKIREEILYEVEEGALSKLENPMTIQMMLVKMLRLKQLADSSELLGESKKSTKLEVLRELLGQVLTEHKKAIVFTQFAEMALILERELADWKPLAITGSVLGRQRQEIVKRFNESDENRVLINTSAGQYGLNLQRASIVIHYDLEWSLSKMIQRVGRAHRVGQKEVVLEYNLLAEDTIDYYIRKVLHRKAELSNAVLGDEPLTMENVRALLK